MNADQLVKKYGLENPSALADSGCSTEEYNACVARNAERIARMTEEEYIIYIEPRNEQIAEDWDAAQEADRRDAVGGKELLKNHDARRIDESPRG